MAQKDSNISSMCMAPPDRNISSMCMRPQLNSANSRLQQSRQQSNTSNSTNNINHIQNKYNSTIINLNGVTHQQIQATAPLSMQQQQQIHISDTTNENNTI
eukprot:244731_1